MWPSESHSARKREPRPSGCHLASLVMKQYFPCSQQEKQELQALSLPAFWKMIRNTLTFPSNRPDRNFLVGINLMTRFGCQSQMILGVWRRIPTLSEPQARPRDPKNTRRPNLRITYTLWASGNGFRHSESHRGVHRGGGVGSERVSSQLALFEDIQQTQDPQA